ncbi:RagB/SusD family nutrient uptake outer membrane protein [Croceiramulus getboli]|nr:RagB/SusD family nutrient uptake outer membrane protein [Flavobacteriaceae bacterium YJPT1-3]
MKKYFQLLFILTLAIGLHSCDDELNELQPFTEGNPETFFTDVASFQLGVDGAYSQLRNYYASSGSGMQGIPDILSDNAILVQSGRRSNQDYFNWVYVASTGGAIPLYFSEAYEAVNAANLVIGQIDNLADGPEKDNILGQALATRAFAHFDLVRTYAKIPTQSADAGSSPGIVYMKVEDGDTGDPLDNPARETVASNYAEIIGDLEAAADLIEPTTTVAGRMDGNSVNGLLSRVYLYTGDWQNAIDAANRVTTPIAGINEIALIYTDESDAGLVIEFPVNTTSESGFSNVGVLYSQSNSGATISEYAVEFEFSQSLQNNDVRTDIIQFVGTNADNDYNAIKKFLGETGQVNGRVDLKPLRAAEVLLNKAEAQFNLGLEADALATLDELRIERFEDFNPATDGGETGAALEEAIQYNRRVELAFEGHRFFDLKRRGESIVRSNNGDIIDGSGTPPVNLTLPAGNFRFQLPIPIGEINANPNFAQNEGY